MEYADEVENDPIDVNVDLCEMDDIKNDETLDFLEELWLYFLFIGVFGIIGCEWMMEWEKQRIYAIF